jgi:hypothetical protein
LVVIWQPLKIKANIRINNILKSITERSLEL